jgi:two-component system sensor histidine kinase ChvG
MAWATAAARRVVRALARIRYRLLLVNVIVAAVPLVGISFAKMHESQLLGALEADMIHQADLVRAFAAANPTHPLAELGPVVAIAARDSRTRIRLLDGNGVQVADSRQGARPDADLPRAPEIADALAGRYGAATRIADDGRLYLHSALPITLRGKVAGVVHVTRSTHDVKVQLYRLRTWLFRVLLASIAMTALVTLVLATTIARPLGRLTRRAERIAARQPVESDRLAKRGDEIGQLARAVAAMTDELERRARDARSLAADISHEFKTPLTGIRGAAELLRDGADADLDARERFLAMILEDAARLDRLVSRLLELARVEDDRGIELPVDLRELARTCAARPWPVAVEVAGAEAAIVTGRATMLAVALDNLVTNASQHAAPGTAVTISVMRRDHGVRVTVENVGPALSPAAQARVWDRFYSTRTASGGSGLGLAIVRSVAHAHGGSTGVACEAGVTRFWLELPRART